MAGELERFQAFTNVETGAALAGFAGGTITSLIAYPGNGGTIRKIDTQTTSLQGQVDTLQSDLQQTALDLHTTPTETRKFVNHSHQIAQAVQAKKDKINTLTLQRPAPTGAEILVPVGELGGGGALALTAIACAVRYRLHSRKTKAKRQRSIEQVINAFAEELDAFDGRPLR